MKIRECHHLSITQTKTPIDPGRLMKRPGIVTAPATARINRLIVSLIRSAYRLSDIPSRASARIDCPGVPQCSPSRKIVFSALALRVGTIGSAAIGPFPPLNSQPPKVFVHRLNVLWPATLWIEIFVSEDERPAMLLRALSGGPERPGMSDVQQTGRGRRQAPAVCSLMHS